MLRYYILVFIVSVFAQKQVHSQTYFNVLDSVCFAYGEVHQLSDTFFVVGAVYNPSGSGSSVLSKYLNNGVRLLADTFSIDGIVTVNGHLEIMDNNFYFFNSINEIPPFNYSTYDLQLSILNNEFNQLYTTLLGGGQQDIASSLMIINNNLFLLSSTNSFGSVTGDFYLIKSDLDGNIIWEQTYGTSANEVASSINKTKDGNILLSGAKKITSIAYNIYLIKVDSSGNVLWEKNYGSPYHDYGSIGSILNDHSFIVYRNVNDGNGGNTIGYVEKLDGNGNLIWSKVFPYNTLSSFSWGKPIENSDGTLIVNCAVSNNQGTLISKIYKLDPFGNTLWTKEYYTRPDLPQYIYDIKATTDGGYIMCGSAFPLDTNIQHAWLVKMNCNGEEGVQHPITGSACEQYDCTQFPIDASFTASTLLVDLALGGMVSFENNSNNTTSRVWNFGDGIWDYTDATVSHTFTQVGTYDVQLIVFHGMCSDTVTQTIEVINTTGIEDLLLETGIQIYPNPSQGAFTVKFKNSFEGTLTIYDMLGRSHQTINLNKGTFNYSVNGLPKGVYLVEVEMNNGRKEVIPVLILN